MKTLTILIPVYNEEKTLSQLLAKVISQKLPGWNKEIIVINDGSTDNSLKILKNYSLPRNLAGLQPITYNLINQNHQGRGKALRTGIMAATGNAIIFQDADLEYDPADWPKLLKEIVKPGVNVIYGSRTISPKKQGYLLFVLGTKILTGVINFFYGSNLTDLYTGYKLFEAKFIKSLNLESDGFELEAELTSKILNKGIKITEVPISYYPRSFNEGKKVTVIDGLKGLFYILKYKFED